MKPLAILGCILCLLARGSPLEAAEAAPVIHLKGIVSISTTRLALLENEQAPPLHREYLLAEGQREEDVLVLEIDVTSCKVTIKHLGNILELALPQETPPPKTSEAPAGLLRLQKASLGPVFEIYQRLAQRSLFRSPSLPALELSLSVRGATGGEMASAIEHALAKNGIIIRPEGDKFAVAAKESDLGKIRPQLLELASTIGQHRKPYSPPATEERIPAGSIDFRALDLSQFLQVYQELTDRTILRASSLRASPIAFAMHTPLTMTEAIYALGAILAMNDISARLFEEKFVVVFPTAESNQAAALLSRKALVHTIPENDLVQPGTVDFRSVKLGEVMAVYHELSGQPIEMDDSLAWVWINLRTQTSLTRTETLAGLEMVLALNGVTLIEKEDGKTLKVVRLGGTKVKNR